jgi:Uma2 family endonuclease
VTTLLTYRDYAALPDDGRRYEIHDGVPSVTPAPGTAHQRISRSLFVALHLHVTTQRLGEVFSAPMDVILSDPSIVQPDILFIARERSDAISVRGIEGAPTLAVEIVSPHSRGIDRQRKIDLYARHGVPHYWIVDPEARSVEAYVSPSSAMPWASVPRIPRCFDPSRCLISR